MSVGISTIAGPLRPLRRLLKARRSTLAISPGTTTCSAELRHAAHLARRAVVRIDAGDAARIALRDHQQRDGLAVGLGDAAIGVLAARTVLHAEGADLLARGDAGDRVGHVQADTFLAHDDRADVGGGGVFQQVVDGIAAEDLDPLALHDFSNCLANLHLDCSHGWTCPRVGRGSACGNRVGVAMWLARGLSGFCSS